MTSLVWFRQDLRIEDNPALKAAAELNQPMFALYILDTRPEATGIGTDSIGSAAKCWLHLSLEKLESSLAAKGIQLVLAAGDPEAELSKFVKSQKVENLFWNRRYTKELRELDQKIKEKFKASINVKSFNGHLLREPWDVVNLTGGPYKVYSSYYRKLSLEAAKIDLPVGKLGALIGLKHKIKSASLASLKLMPKSPDWSHGIVKHWAIGEKNAQQTLKNFIKQGLAKYAEARNIPSLAASSNLSPHLHWGEISIHRVWESIKQAGHAECFLRELAWRDFAYHSLYHFPDLPTQPLREEFKKFKYRNNKVWLKAWQNGLTGYPLVDAGMRQLYSIGWMHNRVRMVVASFLVKDLLIPWQTGAAWFLDTLVDGDLASNSLNWQWASGCGIDAAPYFRIFNPITQSEKFDADGEYIRKWVPELRDLPSKHIHQPWLAPQELLDKAKLKIGKTYPAPLVDHSEARKKALALYQDLPK